MDPGASPCNTGDMADYRWIKRGLERAGRTQRELADYLGWHPSAVSRLLAGERQLKAHEQEKIIDFLGAADVLTGTPIRRIPIAGRITAGDWRAAVEDPQGWLWCESGGPRTFGLRVEGDSMNLLIEEGGYIAIDPDDKDLIPGRIYVVMNGDGETTVKRYMENPARLVPMSDNPVHREIRLGAEPVTVIGRVVWKASPV